MKSHTPVSATYTRTRYCGITLAGIISFMLVPAQLYAYIDPGTTGMLSQLLYVLFYGALGVFLYLLRYFKRTGVGMKEAVSKLLRIKKHHSDT